MEAQPPLPAEIWEPTPPAAQAMIVTQAAALAQLRAEVAQLKATVEALTQRLGRNSRNSSQPPSGDPPQTPPRPRHEPSGRRAGGQPGHEGQARALVPIAQVDVVIPVKPVQCLHCQHPLQGADPQPQRHQVMEIPRVKPVVTEYQLHRLVWAAGGEVTRAEMPVGVPSRGFGPRVQAMTALCTGAEASGWYAGRHRRPRRFATHGADQTMQLILRHHRLHRGALRHVMPLGWGVRSHQ
jgi:transposase